MSFERPELLWLALLALPELGLSLARAGRYGASISLLAGPKRRASVLASYIAGQRLGMAASLVFILAAALSLAGPSWGSRAVRVERSGLELALVLDVSRSMDARDSGGEGRALSRLEAAKASLLALLREAPSASFSLVLAKGEGLLLVPMTEDLEALDEALLYADRESMSAAGTDLGRGILAGLESFSDQASPGRLILLFSDGGDRAGSALAAAAEARKRRVPIYCLGFGGSEAAPIPGPGGGLLLDARGEAVRQALEPELLRSIAAASGGRYLAASESSSALLLAGELAAAGRGGSRTEYEVGDRSAFFLLIALGAFIVKMLGILLAFAGGIEAPSPGGPAGRPGRPAGRTGKRPHLQTRAAAEEARA